MRRLPTKERALRLGKREKDEGIRPEKLLAERSR